SSIFFFHLTVPLPPTSTLFPYTTLFRSSRFTRVVDSQWLPTNGCSSNSDTWLRLPSFAVERSATGAREIADSQDRKGSHSGLTRDRKSTRLNSSHVKISYAVFCLKKKKK